MIGLANVTKKFGSQTAVKDLNLRIKKGELFGFLGPNGAGKTTTIKMLVGLIEPSSGIVTVDGKSVLDEPLEVKSKIGYIPDTPFIYEYLTGREFLYFIGHIFKMEKVELEKAVREYELMFEMSEWLDHPAGEYSHGMKQRVVISSCLIHNPALIVIDEPMVGLDPKSARIVKNVFVEKVKKGVTVFLSTHTLSVAEEICTRIGIINKGELIIEGGMDGIRTQLNAGNKSLEQLYLEITEEKQG